MDVVDFQAHFNKAERLEIAYDALRAQYEGDNPGTRGEVYSVMAVTCFYSVLHQVEAYIEKKGRVRSRNHDDRATNIVNILGAPCWAPYKAIHDLARRARYDPYAAIQWEEIATMEIVKADLYRRLGA
jgi:hypothetical protein